jgi:hypothetical protein
MFLEVVEDRFFPSGGEILGLGEGFGVFLHSLAFADFFYEHKLMILVVAIDKGLGIQKLFNGVLEELVDGCLVVPEGYLFLLTLEAVVDE